MIGHEILRIDKPHYSVEYLYIDDRGYSYWVGGGGSGWLKPTQEIVEIVLKNKSRYSDVAYNWGASLPTPSKMLLKIKTARQKIMDAF